jgi:threonine dehydrogenase-like Zn-dependent dehydrogenase
MGQSFNEHLIPSLSDLGACCFYFFIVSPYKSYGNFIGRKKMETKYGIVGCGYISQLYLNGFKKLGASVVHVADVDLERAKQYAREFGAKASADFHEVVQDP